MCATAKLWLSLSRFPIIYWTILNFFLKDCPRCDSCTKQQCNGLSARQLISYGLWNRCTVLCAHISTLFLVLKNRKCKNRMDHLSFLSAKHLEQNLHRDTSNIGFLSVSNARSVQVHPSSLSIDFISRTPRNSARPIGQNKF